MGGLWAVLAKLAACLGLCSFTEETDHRQRQLSQILLRAHDPNISRITILN